MVETEERHRAEVEKLRESHTKESRAMQLQVSELKEHVARLVDRDDADERLAEAEAAGTRKGISFEERVHDAIDSIAGSRGDVANHTGGEQAEGGGKKGDVLVELGACAGASQGRIVFEAKDKQLSKHEGVDRAQRGDGRARGLVRGPGRRRRAKTSRRGPSS